MTNDTIAIGVQYVESIGHLWKLLLSAATLFMVWYFRVPIYDFLTKARTIKVKSGSTELSVEGHEDASPSSSTVGEARADLIAEPKVPTVDIQPPPSQSPEMLMWQLWLDVNKRQYADAKKTFDRVMEIETDPENRARDQAQYFYLLYTHGQKNDALQALEELATTNERARSGVLNKLGEAYVHSKDYVKAESAYRRAADAAVTPERRAWNQVAVAHSLEKSKSPQEAIDYLAALVSKDTLPEALVKILQGMAEIEKRRDNYEMVSILLEKVLEITPDDHSARFDAAYAQSECTMSQMSICNYDTIVSFNPEHQSAFNNMGVACERLMMPLHSVRYYKSASDMKETLAMANLAYRYMNQGFAEDAKKLLDVARQEEQPHANVGRALADLSEKEEAEEKRWRQIIDMGTIQRQFFSRYALMQFDKTTNKPFDGIWLTNTQTAQIAEQDKNISFEWAQGNERYRFDGKIKGKTAKGSVLTWKPSMFDKVKGEFANPATAYAAVATDGAGFMIITIGNDNPRTIPFTRA